MIQESEKKDIDQNRDVAAFSYFLILSWVILYTRKDSKFIQFHAKQASILFLFAILVTLLPSYFRYLNLITLALAITGLIQTNQGKWWQMPVVANIIESGVSKETAKKIFLRFAKTLKDIFRVSRSQQKKSDEAADVADKSAETASTDTLRSTIVKLETVLDLQMTKLSSLEQQLLVEKFLKKTPLAEMDNAYRDATQELKTYLSSCFSGKVITEEKADHIILSDKQNQLILLGGFKEDTLMIFASAAIPDAEETLGDYSGFHCDPKDKRRCDLIVTAIQKALKK